MNKKTVFKQSSVATTTISTLVAVALMSSSALAAKKETKLRGCRDIGHSYVHGALSLQPGYQEERKQSIYFIQNTSPYTVKMERDRTGKSKKIRPSFQNTIKPNQFGVLAMSMDNLKLSCAHKSNYAHGYGDAYGASTSTRDSVNCANVLKVCEYNRARLSPNAHGTYWMIHSAPKNVAKYKANRKHGTLLRSNLDKDFQQFLKIIAQQEKQNYS